MKRIALPLLCLMLLAGSPPLLHAEDPTDPEKDRFDSLHVAGNVYMLRTNTKITNTSVCASVGEDGTLLVDARANVEELEEYYDIEISREKFDTIGGYLFHLLGSVPKPGEKITDNGLVMMVEESDERKIGIVRIWRDKEAVIS